MYQKLKCFMLDHHIPLMRKTLQTMRIPKLSRQFSVNIACQQEKTDFKLQIAKKVAEGPSLGYFMHQNFTARELKNVSHPYLTVDDINGNGRKVFFFVHGCQMNESDTEIVWSVLKQNGYELTKDQNEADILFIMTCSIRDNAEKKIWKLLHTIKTNCKSHVKIGILGCMAERIKSKFLENGSPVDLVAGPDSYRDLPRLLAVTYGGDKTVNVLLSHDETYAEIKPVSLTTNNVKAYVSIMRGCDNMCTYCIVPFTRGKERSRSIKSIVDEVKYLSELGVKEITLVGQNVNSYRDVTESTSTEILKPSSEQILAKGFKTIYKPKLEGLRFADLLDQVSSVNPEMRIRFVSPHPKDFPDEVLHIIKERSNICKCLHLPAQSGNSRILEMMRRGYTRKAYIDLVHHIREIIPNVSLTSDFIFGFCSETEEEFEDTLSLLEIVRYNFCYMFSYSMREKTAAHRRYVDDIPLEVKNRRTNEFHMAFRRIATEINKAQVGQRHLVLVEGPSKKSDLDFVGRNDGNTKVIFPATAVPVAGSKEIRVPVPGDYVEVDMKTFTSQTLQGTGSSISSIKKFYDK